MSEPSLDHYLKTMLDRQASDLFCQADQSPVLRIDGRIQPTDLPAISAEQLQRQVDRMLTPLAAERFEKSPDLDIAYTLPGVARFRINLFMTQGALALAARAIPLGGVEFDSLNLPDSIREMAERTHGLIMVVGPTGCGKSTTLAALVHLINQQRNEHIVTIEDPIEFVHEPDQCLIHQRQVGIDTESFGTALRHVVRQDPDVILIGELRDRDTIETALSAALTGHLILTTLHTTNVVQTIDRMLNYFPPEARRQAQVDLANTLIGLVSMRLLPRVDKPGRIPATEILRATPTVRRLLAEGDLNGLYDVMKRSTDEGMSTLNRSLQSLVSAGSITQKQALQTSQNVDELRLNLEGMFTGIESIDMRIEKTDE